MGLVDDKKKILTQISVFGSMGKKVEPPDQNSTLPSINNKNEPIPFMLDTLTVMTGSQALEKGTGQVMTDFVRKSEPTLKTSLTQQTKTFNSDKQLSSTFATTGYAMPVKQIDLHGKLKTDPNSQTGSLLYGDNSNNFDKAMYNALQSPGTDVSHNNIIMNYDKTTDHVTIKPQNSSQTIGAFTAGFIGGMTIINEKEFTTKVVDTIFGTTSATQKKTINDLLSEEQINMLIAKISNGDSDLNFTDAELAQIDSNANQRLAGIKNVDVGCSIIDSNVSLNDLQGLISGNTGTTDPLTIGRNFGKLADNSFGKNPAQINPTNKNAIKDGFFKRIIDTIKAIMIQAMTTTPQIRVLMAMVKGFKNNDNVGFTNPLDDIKAQKNMIKCLSDSAQISLTEFIFNLLKTELIKLLIPVAAVILREKLQAYINVIKSLV